MQRWAVICWALLALVGAEECPDGGRCEEGNTCCNTPANGYGCCPFDKAECCGDHIHCCPQNTLCDQATSSCGNATVSVPWRERTPADEPPSSKSFRMIRTYMGEDEDNVCPDQSRCPPEFSCLKALTKFGCCPLAKGVSCSDGKHCCPEGHRCSMDSRSCIRKELVVTVLCGDGVSECPEETTCCETPEGKWGCCPMPKAVCCDDKKHCCPEGTTCDTGHMKCISSSTKKELPMWAKFPARTREDWENQKDGEKEVTAETAPDTDREKNPEANTVPPSKEEVSTESPVAMEDNVNLVPCNDTVACPDDSTCCKTQDGGWSCCLLPEAVCCEDFLHCCPKGKKCNLVAQKCEDGLFSVPWLEKIPAIPKQSAEVALKDVPCDDTSACPDETTCCKTKEGGWACCPLPEAVCCEDFVHCCPKGKKCNVAAQKCEDGLFSVPWLEKIPATPKQSGEVQLKDVPCDDTSACPDETTCCKTKEGGWACCPLPEAVCCEDHEHCCPKGKTCNLASLTCDDSTCSIPWFKKIPAIPKQSAEVQLKDVPCDDTSACPDETTCCKTKEGGWACCPLPEAVCCEDFVHCCPKGKKCNVAAQKCEDGLFSVPWLEKIPATPKQSAQVQLKDVPCDDTSACPDETTCCKTKEGGWACCPLPEAVCCEDFVHCCPKGKKCNVAAQKCEDGLFSVPWLEKIPAIPKQSAQVQLKDVPCDDTSACPDETTCCKTKEGGWACCPLPEAVCCEDFVHCCPKGKKCNVAAQKCEDGLISLPWFEKMPSKPKLGAQMKKVQCDATRFCPDNSTCCKSKDGGWGCCPMPEAVCCEDQVHCCPAGSTCSLDTLSCDTGSGSTPMKEKLPAFPSEETDEGEERPDYDAEGPDGDDDNEDDDDEDEEGTEVEGRIQCDSHTSCPQHTTCCFMASAKKWGCCPLPKAVCCADGDHCCPNDYKCTESQTSCVRGGVVIPWYTKIEASSSVQADPDPGSVQCDGGNRCPEHTSCCRLSTGRWGCCPLQNAVCCPDKEHCCPQGYTCNLASMSCHKLILLQLERLPLTPVYLPEYRPPPTRPEHGDVRCDDQTSCNEDETCCRTSATSWGCCPAANAVCCSDMKHCCPTGYSCSPEGSCSQDTGLNWHNWHVFYANKKRALIV